MRIRRLLDALVAALAGAALAIAWTGGGRFELAGLDVSARDWTRPAIAAAVLGLLVRIRGMRLFHVLMGALAIAAAAVTASAITFAAGGLDSHGYVAASRLFSEGALRRPLPDLSWMPFDRHAAVAAPLGFIPSPDGSSLVPEFPPGLPLLMAAARTPFGPDAVFVVSWLAGLILAAVIYAIARRRYGPLTAALAAVSTLAHPVVVAYGIQPMSDVAASMWTALAVWALAASDRPRPLLGGAAGVMAILTRPPLLLPMAVLAAVFLRRAPRVAVAFGAVLAAGLAALMLLQHQLYGSPFVSGHGGAGQLFTLDTVPHNLMAHGKWFVIVHTPLIVPLLWLGSRSDRWFGGLMLALAGAVAFPYFFYAVPFDDWEMLRFLLPGVVLLLPVAAEGVGAIARRVPPAAGAPVIITAVAAIVLVSAASWLQSRGVFRLALQEGKYPRVAAWIAERAPENAIVFASLHSGSVNYYSGRLTLRWDVVPPERLAATIAEARRRGHLTYLVLDGNDEAARFARVLERAGPGLRLDPMQRILTAQIAQMHYESATGDSR